MFSRVTVLLAFCCAAVWGQAPLSDGPAIEATASEPGADVGPLDDHGDSLGTAHSPRGSSCRNFIFSIVLDEFPEDTKYELLDSRGGVIWEEQPWDIHDQGKQFDRSVCLDADGCYTFIILDNEKYQDG